MDHSGIETGTVLSTDGLWATVITNKNRACKECGKAQAGICGKKGDGMIMKVKNARGAVAGDIVVLELGKTIHAAAYFFAFILPLIALLACAYVGHLVSNHVGAGWMDAAAGLAGFLAALLYSLRKIHALDKRTHLSISKIISDNQGPAYASCQEETDYVTAFRNE